MDRRRFIGALSGGLATPLLYAQQAERVYHIGWLDLGAAPSTTSGPLGAFRRGLGELGWTEGRNVVIETRYGNDDGVRLAAVAAELAASRVDVIVTITNIKDERLREAGEKLYDDLRHAGLEVLLDDRDERAGVKFKDADLIGIPYRITLGKKIAEEAVELFDRRAKQSEDVKLADVVARVQTLALSA